MCTHNAQYAKCHTKTCILNMGIMHSTGLMYQSLKNFLHMGLHSSQYMLCRKIGLKLFRQKALLHKYSFMQIFKVLSEEYSEAFKALLISLLALSIGQKYPILASFPKINYHDKNRLISRTLKALLYSSDSTLNVCIGEAFGIFWELVVSVHIFSLLQWCPRRNWQSFTLAICYK